MSASMAEVLHGKAFPRGGGSEYIYVDANMAHAIAEVLAANGYGKLEDAWDEGYTAACQDSPKCEVPCGACEQCMSPQLPNPYRRPE